MLNVIATITVHEGRGPELEEAVARLRPAMLADEGCLRWDLQQEGRSGTRYWLIEAYASGDALRAHGESDAFRELGQALEGLVDGPPVVTVLRPVGEQVEPS